MKAKVKKSIYILSAVAVIVLFASGMLSFKMEKERPIRIIYVAKSTKESDFWSMLMQSAKMAVEEHGAEMEVMAPEKEEDLIQQNMLIEEAIEKKPDVIILVPADYIKTAPVAEKIKKHGIRLVIVDSLLKKEVADAAITTDNTRAGKMMGEYAKTLWKEDDTIGIVSHVKGTSTAIEREAGFCKGLGDKAHYIKKTVYSDSDFDKAYEVTKEMLLENPDMTLVAGLNEYSTVGAARAVKDMGLEEKVTIIGFDNSIEAIQMLESGLISSIVIQKPFDMGYMGVQTAISLVKGEKIKTEIDSGSKLILKETIYTRENQKLLFPFYEKNKSEK